MQHLINRKAGVWVAVGPRIWGTTLECGHYAEIHNLPLIHHEAHQSSEYADPPAYEPQLPARTHCGICSAAEQS